MKIYMICPVRERTKEESGKLKAYVKSLESEGHDVYFPGRDTEFPEAPIYGPQIAEANRLKMVQSDEARVWYVPTSQGSSMDVGMAFAYGLPWKVANRRDVEAMKATDGFAGFLLHWEEKSCG